MDDAEPTLLLGAFADGEWRTWADVEALDLPQLDRGARDRTLGRLARLGLLDTACHRTRYRITPAGREVLR